MKITSARILVGFLLSCTPVFAWDYAGHRMVNQLALASLPQDFPAFVRTPEAQERIAFLAGEADRWRNNPNNLGFKHFHEPDHYLDLEELSTFGLNPQTMSHFRYEFTGQIYNARAQHPDKFHPIDAEKNPAHNREVIGFLPFTINEYYGKLRSQFSYLKAFEGHGGNPDEIANAQQNIIYIMGVMGHFAGDAAQPLHTTAHHHGWVTNFANPHHYSSSPSIHSWIDGGYIHKVGINTDEMKSRIRPAKAAFKKEASASEDIFTDAMSFLENQNKKVETLYQLNADGDLSDDGGAGSKGRAFITEQLVLGGQFLGDIWYSAWKDAPVDSFLERELQRRNGSSGEKSSSHKSHSKKE